MRVQDVMSKSPKVCNPNTNLAAAAELLSCGACGALPVGDSNEKLVGIIMDRDICVALARGTGVRLSLLLSDDVALGCDLQIHGRYHGALKTMRAMRVLRLPVVTEEGKLEGLVCVSDLIVDARHGDGSTPELSSEDAMGIFKNINWHHSPIVVSTR